MGPCRRRRGEGGAMAGTSRTTGHRLLGNRVHVGVDSKQLPCAACFDRHRSVRQKVGYSGRVWAERNLRREHAITSGWSQFHRGYCRQHYRDALVSNLRQRCSPVVSVVEHVPAVELDDAHLLEAGSDGKTSAGPQSRSPQQGRNSNDVWSPSTQNLARNHNHGAHHEQPEAKDCRRVADACPR